LTIEENIGVIYPTSILGGIIMRALLLVLALFAATQFTNAEEASSSSTWVDTNTVYISNNQSPEIARRDCETTMRILSIMSNDKIVFRSMCEMANHPRCNYYYCYQLSAKALFIPQQLVH
jgi:hypothetical protein